ncbi:MAG: hypothetical protein KGL46_07825 [Hyphomicrobiales bacterium]|nr:hypothetical protein [Hyphomicrobiales bacterium]
MASIVQFSSAISDPRQLPPRVAAMRRRILDACAKGDVEALRNAVEFSEVRPIFERADERKPDALHEDVVAMLKRLSFDRQGVETIALLRAVLRQSCVEKREGITRSFLWPAFAFAPPAAPSADERQIMLSCVRFAELAKIDANGLPPPMTLSIGEDGTWHYFWPLRAPAAGK